MKKNVFETIGDSIRIVGMTLHNAKMDIGWKIVEKPLHHGLRKILRGGVWIDKEDNLYDVTGRCIGKLVWDEKTRLR